jgi:peptidoglycan/LPS O-acetylase OafA/YrhL
MPGTKTALPADAADRNAGDGERTGAATSGPSPRTATRHLVALDGIRGLAALFVVLHHTWLMCTDTFPIHAKPGALGFATNWLLYGHLSVDVFIVLSGFCLTLPVVRRGNRMADGGGAWRFYAKRVRRIFPAYLAALAISLLIHAAVEFHDSRSITIPTAALFFNGLLLQDLFNALQLQSVFPGSLTELNAPLWSVAIETKIYVLFPLLVVLLAGLGQRARPAILLLTAIIGYGLVSLALRLEPGLRTEDLAHSCPWYFFLFGMGVCAASRASGPVAGEASVWTAADRRKWGGFAIALGALFVALIAYYPLGRQAEDIDPGLPLVDAVAGALTAIGLMALVRTPTAQQRLSWRPIAALGTFAYSLYLIHFPILDTLLIHGLVPVLAKTAQLPRFLLALVTAVPLTVALAYVFFLCFERPFLTAPLRAAGERVRTGSVEQAGTEPIAV